MLALVIEVELGSLLIVGIEVGVIDGRDDGNSVKDGLEDRA